MILHDIGAWFLTGCMVVWGAWSYWSDWRNGL